MPLMEITPCRAFWFPQISEAAEQQKATRKFEKGPTGYKSYGNGARPHAAVRLGASGAAGSIETTWQNDETAN